MERGVVGVVVATVAGCLDSRGLVRCPNRQNVWSR